MYDNLAIKTPLMNVMVNAVRKAARGMMRDFREVDNLQVSRKGTVNFVTEADLRAEKTLKEELGKARPDYGFLMEESGVSGNPDAEFRWVVDPLDGTTNFLHAVPYFAISVAVEKRSAQGSEIIAGVIYDPIHDEMFLAEKGEGAYLEQRRLKVAVRKQDFYFVTGTARMVSTEFSPDCSELTRFANDNLPAVIRRSGAAALDLAYVAAGRYDAIWFPRLSKWDMAAGIILVKEAGGIVSQLGLPGNPYESGCIMAASEPSHLVLSDFTRKHLKAKHSS